MSDPVRLLDGGEELSLDERRALQADIGQQSPLGARHAVWGALIVKISTVSASAAAASATVGSATVGAATTGAAAGTATAGAATGTATATTTSLTLLSLAKMGGMGVAAGVAVSTGVFFTTAEAPPVPAKPALVVSAPAVTAVTPRATPASTQAAPVVPPPVETTPAATPEAAPRTPGAMPEGEHETPPLPAVESESQRVARARASLRFGDARQALTLLRALERDEPQGLLGQEREALSIEALFVLGQTDAARTRAETFLARYPASPHAKAVRRAAGVP